MKARVINLVRFITRRLQNSDVASLMASENIKNDPKRTNGAKVVSMI